MTVVDRDEFLRRLGASGLPAQAAALVGLLEPSIRLRRQPARDAGIAIGATKLGGLPDLPPGVAWPSFRGVPQSFIVQIDLADVAGLAGTDVLPPSGLLSVFFDAEQTWGSEPEDRGAWKVMYTEAGRPLERTPFPAELPEHARFNASALRPEVELTLAAYDAVEVGVAGIDVDDRGVSALFDDVHDAAPGGEHIHRLLGHPEPVQGGRMALDAHLTASGDRGDGASAKQARAAAASWRLLLQIDSDDHAGMMWGDSGRIYFWIRREDLARRDFDGVWCILQCH